MSKKNKFRKPSIKDALELRAYYVKSIKNLPVPEIREKIVEIDNWIDKYHKKFFF